ncbi:tricorn protease [Stackebrandtia endophytica]|uniref:Tricorn protease homolog n=1 Tax=Stackebrandtia endophytica TaxID=1496996 RepID=A0A543B1F7_9ACTN|nr:S41 family peptidase [Stackebrandtia endophytica]TQL78649.1 tricorn protease [Stackebrandtia endophytica]
MADGYPRFPTIHSDNVVFVAEDDLWSVPAKGGTARRITSGKAAATAPALSPDGSRIAYVGREDGPSDLYVIDADGGRPRRLTHLAGTIGWVGWDSDGTHLLFSSNGSAFNARALSLWRVPAQGGQPQPLPYGPALSMCRDADGLTVIARGHPTRSAAYQKRYRGGTAGHLWIDAAGSGEFERMPEPHGFVENPHLLGGRVYFLSDHEGTGNVYSYLPDGTDLRRHTDHADFYARHLSGDDSRLVYSCGGRLYLLDPQADEPTAIEVRIPSSDKHRARRYVSASEFMHRSVPTPDGSGVTVQTRGKLFTLKNWDGPVWQHGAADGVAYRLPTWLAGGERLVALASSKEREESLVELDTEDVEPPRPLDVDITAVSEIVASPIDARIAISSYRGDLAIVDLDGDLPRTRLVDADPYGPPSHLTFSPDGRWIAYLRPMGTPDGTESGEVGQINLIEVATGRRHVVTEPVRSDERPHFDRDGRYLFFIGHREFSSVYQRLDFELAFTWGSRPYAVVLDATAAAPFTGPDESTSDTADTEPAAVEVHIDLDGLADRVVPFPVEEKRYEKVLGVKGKAIVLSQAPQPVDSSRIFDRNAASTGVLESVDLATGTVEKIADAVGDVWLSSDGSTLLYRSGQRLRVLKAGDKAPEGDAAGRDTGWIDLDRIKVSVDVASEWPQMFAEAWRLQGEHFWLADMGGIDWNDVYRRYSPLAERVTTRSEFSDLVWEMQGELGNSHAYEMFGDYPSGPQYRQGFLGVEYTLDGDTYRIAKILEGDRWNPAKTSPLNRPGVNVKVGDELVAVNGQVVDRSTPPGDRLADLGGQEVWLTVRSGDEAPRRVKVKALTSELAIRYRDWVEGNRRLVHEATDGRIGYLHIPDMGADGFSEFHRGLLAEESRDGLIVDLRFNGGGHVSPLLLDRLARTRTGSTFSRHAKPSRYPTGSVTDVMVGLTNENAGSDGDLGSHHFRERGLGPLIGTRTWGGTVGISVRDFLVDNTLVTQPAFAMHLTANGWGIENHGVEPDIEVQYAPQDHVNGVDPQLARGIQEVLSLLDTQPADRYALWPFPGKAAPPLPPRGNG